MNMDGVSVGLGKRRTFGVTVGESYTSVTGQGEVQGFDTVICFKFGFETRVFTIVQNKTIANNRAVVSHLLPLVGVNSVLVLTLNCTEQRLHACRPNRPQHGFGRKYRTHHIHTVLPPSASSFSRRSAILEKPETSKRPTAASRSMCIGPVGI